jgi:hypothetical protein
MQFLYACAVMLATAIRIRFFGSAIFCGTVVFDIFCLDVLWFTRYFILPMA